MKRVRDGAELLVLTDRTVYDGERRYLDPHLATSAIDQALKQLQGRARGAEPAPPLLDRAPLGGDPQRSRRRPRARPRRQWGLPVRDARGRLRRRLRPGRRQHLLGASKGIEKVISTIGIHEVRGYARQFSSIGIKPELAEIFQTEASRPRPGPGRQCYNSLQLHILLFETAVIGGAWVQRGIMSTLRPSGLRPSSLPRRRSSRQSSPRRWWRPTENPRDPQAVFFRRWGIDPWTRGYITGWRPGDVMSVGPLHGTHEPPFYVCGSDQWVCGYMEGAVRTGRAAAAAAVGYPFKISSFMSVLLPWAERPRQCDSCVCKHFRTRRHSVGCEQEQHEFHCVCGESLIPHWHLGRRSRFIPPSASR